MYEVISVYVTKQPDGIFIVAVVFNQTDLRSVLSKFYQCVHISTKGKIP